MANLKWNIIHEMDMESGEPTCFSSEINSEKYGKYVWLTLGEIGWNVEHELSDGEFKTLKTCKTVLSAKKWAARYMV